MALTRRDEETGWPDRLRETVLGFGVVALVGGVICAAVVGAVVLLHALRDKEKRAAPVPIAQRSLPPAPLERPRPPSPPPPQPPSGTVPIAVSAPPQEIPAIDAEGFIRHWLVLGPIPFEKGSNGKAELARRHSLEEGSRGRPAPGLKIPTAGREFVWKPHRAPEFFVDFRAALAGEPGEDVSAYAACYLLADEETKAVRFRMGSNDQARVALNGKEVLQFAETRTLQKDQNISEEVKLRKGENLVLFKVVNEKQGWQGCLRLTDRSGAPLRGIRHSLAPP